MGSYRNAGDILPPEVLRMVQEHAEGKTLYIPVRRERRPWGELTGIRAELSTRNDAIRAKYQLGSSVDQLSTEYYLSIETIRRIVRGYRRD